MDLYKQILLLFSIPIYAVIIPLEILLSNFKHKKLYTWKETIVNIYLNLLNSGIDFLMRMFIGFALLKYFSQFHLNINFPSVVYWVLLLLGEDFLFWVEHLVDHRVRLFWAVHITHHSSPEFNLTTGFRSSVFMPVYKYFYFIPLVFLHFRAEDIIFMYSLTQIYGILLHTPYVKRLPAWIEYIFVTPSHHRVHHASNIRYLDKNMGMVFIIWDRIFGTFTKELENETPVFGVNKLVEKPFHPVYILTHEWKDIYKDLRKDIPLGTKLKYLFYPPGWSHDKSTKTTRELQQELEAN